MTAPDYLSPILKALSSPTRLQMVDLLKKRPLCVNAMASSLGISPAAVSQHLQVLRATAIVQTEKRGYFVHYRLNEEALAKFVCLLNEWLT